MSLDARLDVARPDFRLDIALRADGEVIALLGPNGAGKTTALRALAGLTPSSGRIVVNGASWDALPAEKRPVGVVFQDYLLFPHLSVRDNVAFGPRCRGVPRSEARGTADAWLARVGMSDRASAKPAELSGGQAQRVAVARALAVQPELLLLDEPLAALDAATRLEVRAGLARHLAGFGGTTVLVTHDPLDAMVLADRLVVIEDGRIVQEGAPADVARRPHTRYVARLVGLNLFRGIADGDHVEVEGVGLEPSGGRRHEPSGGRRHAPGGGRRHAPSGGRRHAPSGGRRHEPGGGRQLVVAERLTGPVFVAFAPQAVSLYRSRPDGTPRNLWRGRVSAIERHGDGVRVEVAGELTVGADVTPAAVAELGLVPGTEVWVSVKATETHAYPR